MQTGGNGRSAKSTWAGRTSTLAAAGGVDTSGRRKSQREIVYQCSGIDEASCTERYASHTKSNCLAASVLLRWFIFLHHIAAVRCIFTTLTAGAPNLERLVGVVDEGGWSSASSQGSRQKCLLFFPFLSSCPLLVNQECCAKAASVPRRDEEAVSSRPAASKGLVRGGEP
ncbi:hypothetical protein O3P69_015625 [Scylla paramamosain]|uniref:Uncharacterized protein n=1 Tax=Scylla paramamosain TaxID=85552 RepID=A0AAW0SCB4_SCYPA